MNAVLSLAILTLSFATVAAPEDPYDPAPEKYLSQKNLAELQRRHSRSIVSPQPWAGYWWPYALNGIGNSKYFEDGLSPAHKVDLATGKLDWLAAWELANHGLARVPREPWWGHCNGWAASSVMEREPVGVIEVNGVSFSPSDRKAILAEHWLESASDFIGDRVYDSNDFSSPAFWDVTPAQFHLLLANVVGRERRAVLIDRATSAEVWNHPLVAYETMPITREHDLGEAPGAPGVYRVNVVTRIWWMRDDLAPDRRAPGFDWERNDFFERRTLRYELWVDAPLEFNEHDELIRSGDIIITKAGFGGEWKHGTNRYVLANSHPDFMWVPITSAKSTGYKNPRLDDEWVRRHFR